MFYLKMAILPLVRHGMKLMRRENLEHYNNRCIFAIENTGLMYEHPHIWIDLSVLIDA
jgi:hypothetical protein